jgi:predicted Zn-dependent protease
MTQLGALWLLAGSAFFLRGPFAGAAGVTFALAGAFSTLTMLEIELPLTRKQEIEADYVGLMMMAEACYDPRAAVGLWQRMEMLQSLQGKAPPEFLSTHPTVSLPSLDISTSP